MPYEVFMALRYLRGRRRGRRVAQVTALAAIVGIACGVGALIVAFALANGFRDEMRDKILRGTAHITLTRADTKPIKDWRVLVARLRHVEGVVDAWPTTYSGALLSGPDGAAYTLLRGVNATSERSLTELRRTLTEGAVESLFVKRERDSNSHEEPALPIIIGAELATRTGMSWVGDEGWIVTGEKIAGPPGFTARSRRVRVAGVFRSGLFEYDSAWTYLALDGALSIEGAPQETAPVVSIETTDIYRATEVAARVRALLGAEFVIVDWQEANRPLFAALALERRTVGFIIALILIVAALNITTTLVLVVVERRADIAILSAMGARARGVMWIFMIEGAMVGAVGTISGIIIGLVGCFIGDRYRLVSLPADVYSLSAIPFHARASDVLLAASLSFIISLIATIYPARTAARHRPAEGLRNA